MNKTVTNIPQVIVVHPGKQHSFELAQALQEKGMLLCYVTTVYNQRGSLTRILGRFLRGDNRKRFLTRSNTALDGRVIQYCELRGLLLLLLTRVSGLDSLYRRLESEVHEIVYRKSIRLAKRKGADALILFGSISETNYRKIEKYNHPFKVILDVPRISPGYLKEILEADENQYSGKISSNESYKGEDATMFRHLDGFLAGSEIVRRSILKMGGFCQNIRIVPYGTDFPFVEQVNVRQKDVVRFLYVGRVCRQKGIHHLLTAFHKLNWDTAHLTLVGAVSNDVAAEICSAADHVCVTGALTGDMVMQHYRKSDVFVFPSLGDGFGIAGIEAMRAGLPVICTGNAGVSDVVTDGENGLIIPASDPEKLFEAMKFFVDHKELISDFGEKAKKASQLYTWKEYRRKAADAVIDLIQNGG